MRIKRKLFASQNTTQPEDNSQLTSRDIQLEQMKLQRQLMQTQRMKQKIQAEERNERAKRIMQQQKLEQQKEREEDRQMLRVKSMENKENNPNTSLYKTKSHPVTPVSMK